MPGTPRQAPRLERALAFVVDHSLLLAVGAAIALVWANVDRTGYDASARAARFVVNDVAMTIFFALAAKEVYEAMRPGGALSSARTAAVPIVAAVGGMLAPAGIYLAFLHAADLPHLARGWAIPCATDIAFSYLAARLVFRAGSPAVPFLLLLAIADDAFGLVILALFYPAAPPALWWLAVLWLPALAIAAFLRHRGVASFWAYLAIPGALAWAGLFLSGIHPALALASIVPFMPIAALHALERAWRVPVQIVLLCFGLTNAGVPLAGAGFVTLAIGVSLVVGKPIGIVCSTALAELAGFARPAGLTYRSLIVLGVVAGIGFTVALFFATAAFPDGYALDEAKMGALVSLAAAPIAIGLARLLRVGRAVSAESVKIRR